VYLLVVGGIFYVDVHCYLLPGILKMCSFICLCMIKKNTAFCKECGCKSSLPHNSWWEGQNYKSHCIISNFIY